MKQRMYELEDLIREEYEKRIEESERWIWGGSIVTKVLNNLLGDPNVTPFIIKNNGYGRVRNNSCSRDEYIVKAKGTSTVLLTIVIDTITDSDYHIVEVDNIVVTTESKLIVDMKTFMDYCNDRVLRLEKQLDKKANDFNELLKENNLEASEYLKMMIAFNKLDAATRNYIVKTANSKVNP